MHLNLLLLLLPLFMPLSDRNEKIKQAVLLELNHYPEARLRDIYKNFFQDAFGPGHLIPDTAHAGSYLNYELQQPIGDTLKWQPLGPDNNYYRINLSLVKNGTIPRSVLLEAMVESAVLARNPGIGTWEKEWKKTLEVIDNMNLEIADFESDKQAIDSLLSKDEYVMHHSGHYNTTYNRHYRIVHKTIFSRWKETYLKE